MRYMEFTHAREEVYKAITYQHAKDFALGCDELDDNLPSKLVHSQHILDVDSILADADVVQLPRDVCDAFLALLGQEYTSHQKWMPSEPMAAELKHERNTDLVRPHNQKLGSHSHERVYSTWYFTHLTEGLNEMFSEQNKQTGKELDLIISTDRDYLGRDAVGKPMSVTKEFKWVDYTTGGKGEKNYGHIDRTTFEGQGNDLQGVDTEYILGELGIDEDRILHCELVQSIVRAIQHRR